MNDEPAAGASEVSTGTSPSNSRVQRQDAAAATWSTNALRRVEYLANISIAADLGVLQSHSRLRPLGTLREGVASGPPAGDSSRDVIDLDARRRAHRQALREASLHVVVALPHTEGELAAILNDLEDLLLADVDDPGPVIDADPEVVEAVGRLASYVIRP